MKTILICPGQRPGVAGLAAERNLAEVSILGKSLLERWLEFLAVSGRRKLIVIATDYPERIRAFIGCGERWGIHTHVFAERRELSRLEAKAKYCESNSDDEVFVVDRLPTQPAEPLFTSYLDFFKATMKMLESLHPKDRIGLRQIRPGVWTGLRTVISPQVNLVAPCWIGDDARIDSACAIGPYTVVEDRCMVEKDTTLCGSIVLAENYVGRSLELRHSIVSGSDVINIHSSSVLRATDSYLVSSLVPMPKSAFSIHPFSRLFALFVLIFTFPLAVVYLLFSSLKYGRAVNPKVAVRPNVESNRELDRTMIYYELCCQHRILKRWPQLINIFLGEFGWVGNPPLNPTEAVWLTTEFDKLWFKVPSGIFSLADAENCREIFSYEARAHAAFYAVRKSAALDCSIVLRGLALHFLGISSEKELAEEGLNLAEEIIQ